MRASLPKRLLCAFLTVVMIVGVLPASIFVLASDDEFIAPTAEQIKENLDTDGRLIYFNDFDSTTGDFDYNTGATTDGVSRGIENRVGATKLVSDTTKSGRVLQYTGGESTNSAGNFVYKTSVNVYSDANASVLPANSGKSFVWSADVKLGDKICAGYLTSMYCALPGGASVSVQPINVYGDGSLYYGSSYSESRVFAKLSSTDFINLAIFVDVLNNKYDIYVDGSRVVSGIQFLADSDVAKIQSYEGFENGFAITQVGFYREGSSDNYGGSLFQLDCITFYLNSCYVSLTELSTDDIFVSEPAFVAPNAAEIENGMSAGGKIIYYNDFEGAYGSSVNVGAVTDGISTGFEQRVGSVRIENDTLRGGKALVTSSREIVKSDGTTRHATSFNIYSISNATPCPANSGKSFVWSADIKFGTTIAQGYLTSMMCTLPDGTSVSVSPLWLHANGSVYYGTSSFDINRVIGKLSYDKYLNLAVHVNVEKNTYDVYVDGVKQASDQAFLTDAQITQIKAHEGFENGFAVSQIGMYRENPAENFKGDIFQIDNITFYLSDKLVTVKRDMDEEYSIGGAFSSALNESDFTDLTDYYETDAKYWEAIDTGAKTAETVISGQTRYLPFSLPGNSDLPPYQNVWKNGYAGLDVALNYDIKMDSATTVGSSSAMQIRTAPMGGATGTWGIAYVKITCPAEGKYELWFYNSQTDTAGYKIADLSTEKYTNVRVLLDCGDKNNNYYYVYVDGVLKGSAQYIKPAQAQNIYNQQSTWEYTGESAPENGIIFGGFCFNESLSGTVKFTLKNAKAFFYNEDGEGDARNSERKINVPLLLHFNDFENQSITASGAAAPSAYASTITRPTSLAGSICSSSQVIVSDGNGGKAITYVAGSTSVQRYYQMNAQGNSGAAATNLGTDYVISFDFKMTGKLDSSYVMLVSASMKQVNTTTWGADWGLPFVWLKNDGGLYIANKNGGVPVNYYTYSSEIPAISVNNPENKIGEVKIGEFVNIAISVHPSENTYVVYVNGVDATGKLTLLNADDLAELKTSTTYKGEMGITYTRLSFEDVRTVDSKTVFDNYALYFGSEPIKMANGYFSCSDGKLYAYENGQKVPFADSPDGILKTDENGALKIGESYVYSLSDYYVYLGFDLILKDGVYSGFYKANSFTGKTDGNLYYYGKDKIRVAYKTAYDVKDGAVSGSDEVTGYSFDGYGVATPLNGIYALEDGSRYYVNGVRQTGLFTVGGKTYSANARGYLSLSPVDAGNGSYYFFDSVTFEGTVKAVHTDSIIANIGTKAAYTSLEDAIANASDGQTLTLMKNFTLTDAVLFSSDKNITVDLNGKTLTANALTVIGSVKLTDSGDTKGLIKIPKSSISTTAVSTDSIIAWDTDRQGYSVYRIVDQKRITMGDTEFTVIVRPSFDNNSAINKALLGDGGLDNGIRIALTATAYNGGEEVYTRNFVFSDEYVKLAYSQGKAISLRCYTNTKFDDIKVYYYIISDTGMTCKLDNIDFVPTYEVESIEAVYTGSVDTVIFSPDSSAILNKNSGLSDKIQTVGGRKGVKWNSSSAYSITLPSAIPTTNMHTFTFYIYSEAVKDTNIYLYLNPLKSPVEIPINFTGWKKIEIKRDGITVENPTPSITKITLSKSSGSENANIWLSDIVAHEYQFELSVPEGTDANDPQIFEDVMSRFQEHRLGSENTRHLTYHYDKVKQRENHCTNSWNLFKSTYTGADMKNGLFGITISIQPVATYVSWEEEKLTSLYSHILYMTQSYADYGSQYYHNPELLADIIKALDYGYDNFYGSYLLENGTVGNWFPWDIGVPLNLLPTLVYLRNDLTPAQIDKYLSPYDYLQPFPEGNASNLSNMAMCVMLASCLRKDAERLAIAEYFFKQVFEYVTIDQMGLGTDGGFFTDGSFIQHGVTPYHGSYGVSLMQGLPTIMYMTSGTEFDMRGGVSDNQFDFVTDSFMHVMYGNALMATTNGRAVGTGGEKWNFQQLLIAFIQMYSYVPREYKDEFASTVRTLMYRYGSSLATSVPVPFYELANELYYDESVPLIENNYTKVMGNMARVVQHGPEYGVAIALSSKRIVKYESINGANFTGWYHGDGMIYIYTDYADYSADFYFYSNPYLMPGTTVNSAHRKRGNIHPTIPNKYAFAGGVEQGEYGVSGFHLGYDWGTTRDTFFAQADANIDAKKSYFMFDNEIVCLGSNVRDTSGTAVRTVVENRIWRDTDKLSINGIEITDSALHITNILTPNSGKDNSYYSRFDHPASSVLTSDYHEAVTGVRTMHFTNMGGYVFLDDAEKDGNTLKYSKTVITGDASTGTINNNSATGTKSFLEITLDHGTGNSSLNAAYTYVYLPEASATETEQYYANPDVKIIARTGELHSVLETSLRTLGAVFFNADTLTLNEKETPVTKIVAKNGCCVMISTNEKGETKISVSDPTNSLTSMTLDIDMRDISKVIAANDGIVSLINGNTLTLKIDCTGNVGNTYNVTVK